MKGGDSANTFRFLRNWGIRATQHRVTGARLSSQETALVLRGRFDLVTFDDTGAIVARYGMGEGGSSFGYETPRATWHTLVVQSGSTGFFEVKEGPYDPATVVEFAAWAPAEGDAAASAYLEWLRTAPVGAKRP